MGNSHSGSGTSISGVSNPSPVLSAPQTQYPPELLRDGMPIPPNRSESFEKELSSSLSGISAMHAHSKGALTVSVDDFISQGQYKQRYRANSVSIDPDDVHHQIPDIKQKVPAVIRWDKGGTDVSISGTFNKWEKKIPLVKSSNNFFTIIELEEGDHQYKYHVDGHWVVHPDEPTVSDSQGNVNNVVSVKQSDFDLYEALDRDSNSTKKDNRSQDCQQSEYGQEVPQRKTTDRHVGPPLLPSHLLQVVLDKEVPAHVEPGILPEPNHVMLNHLYALSIKDGVMVLSDTSRFRKKYVTTLLYKPIDS